MVQTKKRILKTIGKTIGITVAIIIVLLIGTLFLLRSGYPRGPTIDDALELEPDPIDPSASQPITLSRNVMQHPIKSRNFHALDLDVIKVAVFNPTSSNISLSPELICEGLDDPPVVRSPSKIIPSSSFVVYLQMVDPSRFPLGQTKCTIQVNISKSIYRKEITVLN